jgi:NAD(P)-dependent dehydrogenase (short-subunit alcohol dehydrogenase family)
MEIAGRVAVVTGGAQRVGRAIATALAHAGADVFVHYNRSAGPAEEVVAGLQAMGVRAASGPADLSDPASGPGLIADAAEALGAVSILVNSASGFATDTLADVTPDGWQRSHAVTLAAPVFLTQAFAAALPDGMEGAVVNVTDVRTATPYRTHFSYVVAKGGLDAFTRAAAVALAPRIRVNAVALGVILPPPGEDDGYAVRLAERLPLQRVGGTDPVTATVRFLVSNDFVTGEIVRVDGGGHLA